MSVEIRVGGKRYGGWTEVSVRTSLEESAGQFRVVLSAFDPGTESPLDIGVQKDCSVWVDGTKVITGIVERVTARDAVDGSLVQLEGRSKTAQLECSVATAKGRHKRRTPLQIAQALAVPFGVTVAVGEGVTLTRQVRSWTAKASESVHGAIERLVRPDNLLLTDDADGRLVLTSVAQSGPVAQTIRAGEGPVLAVESTADATEVFSDYYCRGQSYGTDNDSGEAVSSPSGYASDPDVTLHRPTVIDADGASGAAQCRERARAEAATRAGRSVPVRVQVQGWQWADGTVVQKGQRVRVVSTTARLDGVFVVVSVDYTKSHASGTIADLVLLPPSAFTVDEIVAKPSKRRASPRQSLAEARAEAAATLTQMMRAAVGVWK